MDQELTVENAGEKHNEMTIDFLNYHQNNLKNTESSGGRVNSSGSSEIVAYLDEKYGTDLNNSPYYLFKSTEGDVAARTLTEEFDPYKILEENRGNVSEYFYSKFESLLKHTEHFSDNPGHVASVINAFKEGVTSDENFSQEERENFLLMLDVHQSSLELWAYVEQVVKENNPEGRLLGVPRDLRWKIVAADFTGGLIGGLASGGTMALAGLAASSIEMTIGLWEYTIPACASYDMSCQLSTGNISNINPSVPTGSTAYTGQLITSPCQFYVGGC